MYKAHVPPYLNIKELYFFLHIVFMFFFCSDNAK
jgi:hypothetical protein